MTARTVIEIFVTYVDAEGPLLKIWGQCDRSSALCIEQMLLQCSQEFKQGCGVNLGSSMYPGLVCCARYEGDGVYYRAKILSVDNLSTGEVLVKFIDYGNKELVTLDNIRILSDKQLNAMNTIPPQAEEFYLAGVIPPLGEWDFSGLTFIRRHLCYLELKGILASTVCSKKLLLLLYENADFSQVLIEKNLGISIDIKAQEILVEGLFGVSRVRAPDYTIPENIPAEEPSVEFTALQVPHIHNQVVNRMVTVPILEINSEHTVRVSHIEDGPAAFSVQLLSRDKSFKSLTKLLNEFAPRSLTEPLLPGSVCVAKCPTNKYMSRAVVTSVHEFECKLYFVDIGSSGIVPYSEIYELSQKYMVHKCFALNFTLAGLRDISLNEEGKIIFSELVNEQILTLRVVPAQGPRIKQYGELFLNGQNLLLILAQRLEFLRRMQTFPSLPFPAIGEEAIISVSYVASVSNFYVHLQRNSEQLDEIMNSVKVYCSDNASVIMMNKLSSGTPICALYSADNQWYRAKVMSVVGDRVSVLYVDYGNTDILPLSSLKPISENLMKMSAQAVPCCLNGFETLENNELESSKLEEDTTDKILKMVVVDHLANGMLLVELIDCSVLPLVNIGNQILAISRPSQDALENIDWEGVVNTSEIPLALANAENTEDWSPFAHDSSKSGENERERQRREPCDRWRRTGKTEELSHFDEKIKSEGSWGGQEHTGIGSKHWNANSTSRERDKSFGHRDKDRDMYEKKWGGRDYTKRDAGYSDKKSSRSEENDGNAKKFNRHYDGEDRKWSGSDRRHGFQNERFDSGRSDRRNVVSDEQFDGGRKRTYDDRREGTKAFGRYDDKGRGSGKWATEKSRNEFKTKSHNDHGSKNFKNTFSQPGDKTRRVRGSEFSHSQESNWTQEEDLQIYHDPFIPLKSKATVELVYVANPSDFVVQISDNISQLDDMMAKIAARYDNDSEPALPSSSLKVGMPCIARYAEDNTWYRAVVQHVNDSIVVCFIDYGNKDTVKSCDLKKISQDLLTIPILGVHCSLIGVGTAGSEWTNEDIALFTDMTDGKPLMAHFIRKVGKSVQVILRGLEDCIEEQLSVNEKLGANSFSLSYFNPEETPSYASAADCYAELTIIPDTIEKVEVTWFINPEQFYCQIKSSNYADPFKEMMNSIQASNLSKTPLNHSVSVGTPVIAKYPLDGVLYRAVVKENSEVGNCTVQFVDYGNCDTVEFSNLWLADKKFMNIPRQAIPCCLFGVKPVGSRWPIRCVEYEKLFGAEELDCLFHGSIAEDRHSVSLYKDEVSLVTELVTCGLAEERKPDSDHLFKAEPVNLSLLKGQQLAAHVTFIYSISEFFVHLEPLLTVLLQAKLLQLEDKQSITTEDLGSFNDLRLVNANGTLYRGKVVSYSESSSLLVDLVDFGQHCTVDVSNVWTLPDFLTSIPYQATKCCVTGCSDGTIPSDLEEHFKMEVEDQDVIMLVDDILNGRLCVRLFDIEGQRLELLKPVDNSPAMEVSPICPLPIMRSCIPVWVVHTNGPYALWLQRVCDAELLAKLLQDLYTFYEAEGRGKSLHLIEKGEMCAAKSLNDGGWYRAFIEMHTSVGVSVCFTDYGNSEVLPKENIKELDPSFYSPHSLAFCASLPLLAEDETKCKDFLTDMVNDKELTVNLKKSASGKWLLDSCENLNLTQQLIDANLAHPVQHAVLTGKILLSSLIKEYTGNKIEIVVPFCESPGKFWIQDKNYIEYINGISYRLHEAKDFPSVDFASRGMPCVAYSPENEEWYRARILNICENETISYEVHYIDYGNIEVVNSICVLPEDLCKLPPLAEECKLKLPEGLEAWPDSSKEKFLEISGDGETTFLMEIKERGEPLVVTLFHEGTDISQQLLQPPITQKSYEDLSHVIISHVESVTDFWVQYNSTLCQLDEITDELSFAENFEPLSETSTGVMCAALYDDDQQWYRATIVCSEGEESEVLFIDYGNSSSSNNFRSLPSELSKIPPLAQHCSLPLPEKWSNWPTAADEEFINLIGDGGQHFELTVLQEGEPCIVTLKVDGLKVEDLLCQKCGAEDVPKGGVTDLGSPSIEEGCTSLERECFSENIESNSILAGNSVHLTETFTGNELLLADVKLSWSLKLKECTSDKMEVVIPFSYSAEKFWIQDKENIQCITDISCHLMETSFPINFPIKEMTCGAFSPENEEWYRAKILNICESETTSYEVQYIDYGNIEVVDSICALTDDLCKIPPLSEECKLKLPEGLKAWPESSKEKFLEISGDGETTFLMEIKERGEPLVVTLFHKGTDISQQLLQLPITQKSYEDLSQVIISHIKSVTDFWIQYNSTLCQLNEITDTLSFAENFEPLSETSTGVMCAALYDDDQQWYRATIVCSEGEESEVLFIDYGNSSSSNNLRTLPSELSKIPPLAQHCSLPLPEKWSNWPTAAEEEFINLIGDGGQHFELTVLQEGEPCIVTLKVDGFKVEDLLCQKCGADEYSKGKADVAVTDESCVIVETKCSNENQDPSKSGLNSPRKLNCNGEASSGVIDVGGGGDDSKYNNCSVIEANHTVPVLTSMTLATSINLDSLGCLSSNGNETTQGKAVHSILPTVDNITTEENSNPKQSDCDGNGNISQQNCDNEENTSDFKIISASSSLNNETDSVEDLDNSNVENEEDCQVYNKTQKFRMNESFIESCPLQDAECDSASSVNDQNVDKMSNEVIISDLEEKTEDSELAPLITLSNVILSEREPTFKIEHSEKLVKDFKVEMKTHDSKCHANDRTLVTNGSVTTSATSTTATTSDD